MGNAITEYSLQKSVQSLFDVECFLDKYLFICVFDKRYTQNSPPGKELSTQQHSTVLYYLDC